MKKGNQKAKENYGFSIQVFLGYYIYLYVCAKILNNGSSLQGDLHLLVTLNLGLPVPHCNFIALQTGSNLTQVSA